MLTLEDLADLRAQLQGHHFRIAPHQVIAAQRVLDHLRSTGKMPPARERLAGYLGPIFCAGPLEQSRFSGLYGDWLKSRFGSPSSGETDRSSIQTGALTAASRGIRRLSPSVLALLALILLVTVAWATWQNWRPRELTGTVVLPNGAPAAGARVTVGNRTVDTDPVGHFAVQVRFSEFPTLITALVPERYSAMRLVGADVWRRRGSLYLKPSANRLEPVRIALNAVATPGDQVQIVRPETVADIRNITASPAGTIDARSLIPIQRIDWVSLALAFLPLMLLAVWSIWWLRRQPVLRRRVSATPRSLRELFLPGGINDVVSVLPLRRLAQEMRRRRLVQSSELQVERTVEMTVRRLGIFTPVLGSRVEPNYLVLVDTAGLSDHQARFAESIINELVRSDVLVDRFVFSGNPAVCYPNEEPHAEAPRTGASLAVRRSPRHQAVVLEDLHVRYPDHRVLLFGDAATLFNAFSGAPIPSVEVLQRWPMLFLLTPRPTQSWTEHERVLARLGASVLPLTRNGMLELMSRLNEESSLNNHAPNIVQRATPVRNFGSRRWLDRDPPSPADIAGLLEDLRADLGERGLVLLAACAAYPEIHWGITIRLAADLIPDGTAMDAVMPRIARLIWFREAYMPDWLRAELLQQLSPEDDARIRNLLLKMLERVSSAPALDVPLRIATDSRMQSSTPRGLRARIKRFIEEWRTRRQAKRLIKAAGPESPLRDYVFLQFVSGETVGSLNLSVPERLLRAVFRGGSPLLGFRRSIVAVLAVVATVALFFLLNPVNTATFNIIPTRPSLSADGSTVTSIVAVGFEGDWHPAVLEQNMDTHNSRATTWSDVSVDKVFVASVDNRWLAACTDGRIVVWDTQLRGPTAAIKGDYPQCSEVRSFPAISPDGRFMAYARMSGEVEIIWDIGSARQTRTRTSQTSQTLSASGDFPGSVEFSTPTVLGIGYASGAIEFLDVPTAQFSRATPSEEESRTTSYRLVFSKDGRRVAWSNGAVAAVWDVSTRQRLARFEFKSDQEAGAIALSPDGKLLAVSSVVNGFNSPTAARVMLFDVDTNSTLAESLTGEQKFYTGLAFGPDGRSLATTSYDGIVGRWKLPENLTVAQPSAAYALVIGSGRSSFSDDVDAVLTLKFGFGVTRVSNAGSGPVRKAFQQLTGLLRPEDRLLIYVLGNDNIAPDSRESQYRVMTASESYGPEDDRSALSGTELIDFMATVRAKEVLLILDTPAGETLVQQVGGKTSRTPVGVREVIYTQNTRGTAAAFFSERSSDMATALGDLPDGATARQLVTALHGFDVRVDYARLPAAGDNGSDSANFFLRTPGTVPLAAEPPSTTPTSAPPNASRPRPSKAKKAAPAPTAATSANAPPPMTQSTATPPSAAAPTAILPSTTIQAARPPQIGSTDSNIAGPSASERRPSAPTLTIDGGDQAQQTQQDIKQPLNRAASEVQQSESGPSSSGYDYQPSQSPAQQSAPSNQKAAPPRRDKAANDKADTPPPADTPPADTPAPR
jgi:WD40 repeat protein